VKSYLDEIATAQDPTSAETKDAMKEKGAKIFIPHSVDFPGDLESAWAIWDAVYAGVKAGGKLFKDSEVFAEVDEWLAGRR